MKKILSGFLGLFAVIGLVAGAGYALFTTSANLNGMVLGTATPGLLVSLDNSDYRGTLNLPDWGVHFEPLLPGETDRGEFWLENTSNGTFDQLDMNLQARITAAGGDWGDLSNVIQAKICLYDNSAIDKCGAVNTPFYTLAQWNAAAINLPGNPLHQDVPTHYTLLFYIPSSYTSTVAGKTITGMNIVITGTQVP